MSHESTSSSTSSTFDNNSNLWGVGKMIDQTRTNGIAKSTTTTATQQHHHQYHAAMNDNVINNQGDIPHNNNKETKKKNDNIDDNVDDTTCKFDLHTEARLLFNIAIPTVCVQISIFFLFPQTASSVGRQLGTEELAGFSLASLTGNMTVLSVVIGALSATETLMPRAYGTAEFDELGRLAVRAFVCCVVLLIPPIVPLCVSMDFILDLFGQDPRAAALASRWIRIYLVGVPSVILFRVVQRFLAAQNVVWPLVYAGVVGCFVIQPVLLGVFVPLLGFEGSALALVSTQTLQSGLLLMYLKVRHVHHPETWPGLSWSFLRESIRLRPMLRFMKLSLGGVLSLSEWWFWEVVCFTAGTFGVIPLCVHTVAYQLVPMFFMFPLGMSMGMSVRIGTVLTTNVEKAKKIAMWGIAFTATVGAIFSLLLYHLRGMIVRLFTSDPEVIEGCEAIWHKVSIYIFILYIFGINSGILRALGLQWRMAISIISVLWCTALPIIRHVAVRGGGGLDALWGILPFMYVLLNVVLCLCYVCADWYAISEKSREKVRRSIVEGKVPNESTYLLNEERRQSASLAVDIYP